MVKYLRPLLYKVFFICFLVQVFIKKVLTKKEGCKIKAKDGKVENAKAPKKKKEKKGNGVKEKIKVEETAEEISEASGEEK